MRPTLWTTLLLSILPHAAVAGGELRIDDFADGDLDAEPGLGWMVIGDDMVGGRAEATLAVAEGGEDHTLVLEGRLGTPEGLPVSFVGAWTAVGTGGLARDLSAYSGVRLRARAAAGRFQLGLRRGGAGDTFTAPLELGADWTEVDVPFTALRAMQAVEPAAEWSSGDVTWVGLSASATEAAPVRLELDRIGFYGGSDAAEVPPSSAGGGSPAVRAQLADPAPLERLEWTLLAEDPAGDGLRSRLPDATALAWAPGPDGSVWFRVSLAGPAPERWMGVNVALDLNDDPADGTVWWGTNSGFRFDRLVTAYLTRVEGYWMGALGVASAASVALGVMDEGWAADVVAAIDRRGDALLVGVPREALASGGRVRLIATVGSSMVNNDDVPDAGAVELTLPALPAR